MFSMSAGNVEARPRRHWFENPWIMAAISFVACILAYATAQLCRFTLEPLRVSDVGIALFFGLMIGGMAFFVLVGPCQLLIALMGLWRKLQARTISFLMLIPASFIVCIFIHSAISWRYPAGEVERFEAITGAPWPAGAKMLLAEHGWGWQDKRHLWVFEGTSEQFDKLVLERGWVLEDASVRGDISRWMPVEKAEHCFSTDSAWSADQVYFWMADKHVEKGPFGPENLITDKEHRRWCVWWDAI